MKRMEGVVALNTLPELNSRREKAEAELADLKTALREALLEMQTEPRPELHGRSFRDAIRAKRSFVEAIDVELRNRMRTPNQIVFDFDGDVFRDVMDVETGEG